VALAMDLRQPLRHGDCRGGAAALVESRRRYVIDREQPLSQWEGVNWRRRQRVTWLVLDLGLTAASAATAAGTIRLIWRLP